MTLEPLITAARIQARLNRRKELDAQLLRLMHGRDEQDGEQFQRWAKQVEHVRRQIADFDAAPNH